MKLLALAAGGVVVVLLSIGANTPENLLESCFVVPDRVQPWGEAVGIESEWSWWPPGWGCRYENPSTGVVVVQQRGWLAAPGFVAGLVVITSAAMVAARR